MTQQLVPDHAGAAGSRNRPPLIGCIPRNPWRRRRRVATNPAHGSRPPPAPAADPAGGSPVSIPPTGPDPRPPQQRTPIGRQSGINPAHGSRPPPVPAADPAGGSPVPIPPTGPDPRPPQQRTPIERQSGINCAAFSPETADAGRQRAAPSVITAPPLTPAGRPARTSCMYPRRRSAVPSRPNPTESVVSTVRSGCRDPAQRLKFSVWCSVGAYDVCRPPPTSERDGESTRDPIRAFLAHSRPPAASDRSGSKRGS